MELIQAKVTNIRDPKEGEGQYIDVLQLPTFMKLDKVEMPRLINSQELPGVGDIVLIWKPETGYPTYIRTLKIDYSGLKSSIRREVKGGKSYFQPGEVQHESKGGAYHYISNRGDHHLVAGNTKEKIRIQGSSDTILVEGSNLDFRTPSKCRIFVDENDNISIQFNDWSDPLKGVESEIKLNSDGDIIIQKRNGLPSATSVEKSSVTLKANSEVEIKTNDSLGITKASATLKPDGTVIINGDNIKLGEGANKGVARKGDSVEAVLNALTGPGFAANILSAAPGSPCVWKPGASTEIAGTITSSSDTVKAED